MEEKKEPTSTASQQKVNRQHKDILFRYILTEKKTLLTLYNALNGTDYTNENDLEINTLEDAIYLGHKNDLSFIVGNTLNLYEHQSSINPNMPYRGLCYITSLYEAHVKRSDANVYGRRLVRLPYPQYVVFYNGVDELAERTTLRLSDAYMEVPSGKAEACLEMTATVININHGKNKDLLTKCRELGEYADFIHRVRSYRETCRTFEDAVDKAVDECIEQNILREILERSKSDMKFSILTEYDQEKHYEGLREEGEDRAAKKLESVLAEKDSIISEKDNVISEKDILLGEKDILLSEKDAYIKELMEKLAAKDG